MGNTIKIEPEALKDIQEAIIWYNEKQPDLGASFLQEVKENFSKLKINPYFQIRYDNVRCLPLNKFPFMVHFTFSENEKLIIIRAVLNTSINPDEWKR